MVESHVHQTGAVKIMRINSVCYDLFNTFKTGKASWLTPFIEGCGLRTVPAQSGLSSFATCSCATAGGAA